MNLFKTRWFIGLACFSFGAAFTLGLQHFFFKPKSLNSPFARSYNMDPLLNHFFNDDFFDRAQDPFEEMRRMRKEMMKQLDQGGGGGGGTDIQQREDQNYVYYDIAVEGLKEEKVNVQVENGQLTISGQVEKKSEGNGSNSYFSSSFHRSFPVPSRVNADQFQVDQQKNRLVVKFPKRK